MLTVQDDIVISGGNWTRQQARREIVEADENTKENPTTQFL